ncbi:DUF4136 domain-containing protein [Geotalea sp. SG265]|uniref:DUF4136 domain-containing protein n=1 Tax=Geotalea sp. SG265 TaxID=2922867 RepID=UPI001FAFB3E4|nr:DUF4136 domain-containing protein [Geotalea sp. SG265]
MQPFHAKLPVLLVLMLFLTSCAATHMVDSWHAPSQGKKYQKLLVSRVTQNRSNQQIYEDVVSAELKQRGVDAVPAHLYMKNGDTLAKRQALENAVRESGAEAILSIQTTGMEKRTNVQPGYMDNYPGYWYPSAFPYWDMYGYYGGAATFYEPPVVTTYNVATIQVHLFDTASGKLVWAATFESTEPGNAVSVSKDLAGDIIDSLSRDGML